MRAEALVAKDTASILSFIVKDSAGDLVPDITGATLRWRIGANPLRESTMTVDAPNSRVWYQFQHVAASPPDDEYWELSPGTLRAEVVILDVDGKELTSLETFSVPVRDRL